MKVYLVGGAVRDALLGLPVHERDWVVVGATPEAMAAQGYRPVGRDFPVFLHPETGEEYALARTERKHGRGHQGFVFHAGPDITLEEDLRRRDLTINAIAQDQDGRLIDPFGGRADLADRVLRHVSEAFVEDPLRVFRVARFAARFAPLGFEVAAETRALMRDIARSGELETLSAERVWQEAHKALAQVAAHRFIAELSAAEALRPWFAECDGLTETLTSLWSGLAVPAEEQPLLRFGALGWVLDREAVRALSERLKVPRRFQQLAEAVARHGRLMADWVRVAPDDLLEALRGANAFRQGGAHQALIQVAEHCAGTDLSTLAALVSELQAERGDAARAAGYTGKDLGRAIDEARLALIRSHQAA